MARSEVKPEQGEAVRTASPSDRSSLGGPARPRWQRPALIGTLAVISLAAAGQLAWQSSPAQEWRLSRAPLSALLKERETSPENARLLYYLGLRLNQQGRFAEAESNLRHAVGLDPESDRLRDEWARAQLGTGKISDAFTQLRQFAGLHPRSPLAHISLGKFYFAQHSMQRAREELESALALAPDNAEGWAYLSQAYSQLGIAGAPIDAARKAIAFAPDNAGYHLLLASLLAAGNQPSDALPEYTRAVTLAPENAAIHREFASYLYRTGRNADDRSHAESEARRALALDASDAHTYLLLGHLLRDARRPTEAIDPLTRAADLLPDDPTAPQALTQAYQALQKAGEAQKWQTIWQSRQAYITERHALYQKLRVAPQSRDLHAKMARLLGTHGDVEGCLRSYSMALRRPPDAVQTLVAASRDLTAGGFADRALPLAQRAVVLGPHSPEAREALGDALLQTGKVDEAIASYNYTTNYAPGRAAILQERVNRYVAAHPQPTTPAEQAYREARKLLDGQIGLQRTPVKALEWMEKANTLDPGNLTYLRLLFRLQFGARKMDAAITTARQIVHVAPTDMQTQALLGVLLADRAASPSDIAEARSFLDAAKNAPDTAAQRQYGAGLLALRQQDGPGAVRALKEAARLDPAADITFYKLAQAERMCGHTEAAAQALAEYDRRQKSKQREFSLQGDVSQHPDRPEPYRNLAAFYKQNGRMAEANAIRQIIRRRFTDGKPDLLRSDKGDGNHQK